jgi:hypothetical protein
MKRDDDISGFKDMKNNEDASLWNVFINNLKNDKNKYNIITLIKDNKIKNFEDFDRCYINRYTSTKKDLIKAHEVINEIYKDIMSYLREVDKEKTNSKPLDRFTLIQSIAEYMYAEKDGVKL